MSDVTFDQHSLIEERPKAERKVDVDSILTIDDITNVADHIVSTRRASPLKKIQPDPIPKLKTKPKNQTRTKSDQRPLNVVKRSDKDKVKEGRKIKESSTNAADEIEFQVPTDLSIDKHHCSIDSVDIPFIDTKTTLPSIQLFEFQQPPQSTSTPFNTTLLEAQQDKPISESTSPLASHPIGYSTPVFHFTPFDDFMDESLTAINEGSSSLSGLVSNESPLANKHHVDAYKEDIHSIAERIKTSMSIKSSSPYQARDLSIGDASVSFHDKDMKTPIHSSSSIEFHLPSKSIMRNSSSSSSDKVKKRVRIDESTLFNTFKPVKSLKKKRRAHDDPLVRSSKKVKLLHKVDSNTSYSDLLALCGDEKDPIDLILR